MSEIKNLEPKKLWEQFYNFTQTPRPSKHEEKIIEYLKKFAEKRNLDYDVDKAGNVVIRKVATEGYENKPGVIIQNHIDMVCEKLETHEFDFMNDPIITKIEGDWVTADKTTLGADNGMGAAAALAILDSSDVAHSSLECLFTIDEETGLTGALALENGFCKNKILINLDSEEDDAVYIGCAGGITTNISKRISRVPNCKGLKAFRIKVNGLQGGHSGLMIELGLGNAVKLLGRFLWNLKNKINFRLADFAGGDKHNAIPRECYAEICIDESDTSTLMELAKEFLDIYRNEYRYSDPDVTLTVSGCEPKDNVLRYEDTEDFIGLIYTLPHGVLAKSRMMPDLVETSTNLAKVVIHEDWIEIMASHRSSVGSSVDDVSDRFVASGKLVGYDYKKSEGYPAWQPNKDANIVKVAEKVYNELFGEPVEVKVIHAGLECGIISERFGGVEAVSFGPLITGAHTPDERVNIPSTQKFYKYLLNILRNID